MSSLHVWTCHRRTRESRISRHYETTRRVDIIARYATLLPLIVVRGIEQNGKAKRKDSSTAFECGKAEREGQEKEARFVKETALAAGLYYHEVGSVSNASFFGNSLRRGFRRFSMCQRRGEDTSREHPSMRRRALLAVAERHGACG